MPRVFLFDIDGTLMRGAGPQHGNALVEAIREVTGVVTSMDNIPVHGMLDPDILRVMMTRAGIDLQTVTASLPAVIHLAQTIYPERCPDLRSKVLPGVRELLADLKVREYRMGLVTGNLSRIGWTKVERAALKPFFTFGAFAEMAPTRTELARLALTLSGAGAIDPAGVTLIGDAPSDVEAAQANGFRMISVATGMTGRDELSRLKPDLVLTDLANPMDRAQILA